MPGTLKSGHTIDEHRATEITQTRIIGGGIAMIGNGQVPLYAYLAVKLMGGFNVIDRKGRIKKSKKR